MVNIFWNYLVPLKMHHVVAFCSSQLHDADIEHSLMKVSYVHMFFIRFLCADIPDLAFTVHKMMFSIKGIFSKCDHMHSFLWIWSHLLKKSLLEHFIFCAVFRNLKDANSFKFW